MKRISLLLLIVTVLLLAGCVGIDGASQPSGAPAPTPAAAEESAAPAAGGLTADALRNATYSGVYDEPITLTDGRYESEPAAGDTARPVVEYVDGAERFGDLDGDGVKDAVVFLPDRGGGSATFTYVGAQLNR
ncbi:MAG TPA: hypothetical protein PKE20_06685, partial [Promineifilum sp.]|nr:hypothetical protein [Promineifilum sp.]